MSKVFLLSLAAVLALGWFVLAGKLERRTELRVMVRTSSVREAPDPEAGNVRAKAVGERLAAALDTTRGSLSRVAGDLGKEFGPPESVDADAGRIVLVVTWDRLPELLARVARRPAGGLLGLQAKPGPSPDTCRVELALDPPPDVFVPR